MCNRSPLCAGMAKRWCTVLALALGGSQAFGQLLDSLGALLDQPPRAHFSLDARGSFISNQSVRFLGAKAGVEHGGRLRYGLGYSFLLSPVEDQVLLPVEGLVTTRLRMGYITPFVSYAFYQTGPWQVSLPVQLGLGSGSVAYRTAAGQRRVLERSLVLLYEPAMVVQYRFTRYLGVQGGWGFRLAFRNQAALADGLTAPVYFFGLKMYLAEICAAIKAE
jgi:hypothetical protein